jgi:uncharacterized protein YecT (DUF1311 family)
VSQICLGGVRLVCSAGLLLTGEAACGASFDCTKAQTPQEKAICASPELSAADDKMAAAYRAVLANAPPEWISELRDEQRTWIRKMAGACPSKGSESSAELTACLLADEDSRTKELEHMILRTSGVTFVWRSVHLAAAADPNAEPIPAAPNAGPGSLDASWPQTKAYSPEWRAWNAGVEAATYEMASVQDGGSGPPAGGKIVWAADPGIDVDVTTSLGIVSARLVTASITNNWDGHSAHPNLNFIQFNWMLKEKREMKPEDIFRPGSDWDKFLQKRCDEFLHKQLDYDGKSYEDFEPPGEMAKTLHGIVSNPRSWSFDGDGLTIPFEPYAVACHACTPPPVTISWHDLKPFLQTTFTIPKTAAASKQGSSD